MPKYNYKDDAMTAFMKGKISAQELDKISKNQFKTSVATKQELQNFLKSGYMKELMANTYGLKVPAMEKKVKELMRFAESMQFEGMFSTIDQIRQDSKDVRDFVKNVFKDRDFKKMSNDKDFIKYLKSIYEGFASDAQRKAAFANGYEEKGKKKESISDHPKASWKKKKNESINEISAKKGLEQVVKGNTKDVEGIKVSKEMAQAMLDWFNSSPYGRKYPKAKNSRLHISIGIMLSFGLERYAKHKGAKQELKYLKSMRESANEGKKRFKRQDGIGKAKYTISYHDGKKKHKDGSDFFDIQIFRNKKDLAKFVNTLHKGGYVYGFGESVNEGKKRYYQMLPESKMYAKMHDFNFYRLEISQARWIGGFGKIAWLKNNNWRPIGTKWSNNEESIIDHMNNDHSKNISASLNAQHGIKDKNAKMFALTIDGYYLRSEDKIYFIAFDEICINAKEYKDKLVNQAKEYRSFEI